eukprot:589572-Rhodomonas_salina.2
MRVGYLVLVVPVVRVAMGDAGRWNWSLRRQGGLEVSDESLESRALVSCFGEVCLELFLFAFCFGHRCQ